MSCTIITVGSWFVSMLTDSIQHGNNPRVGHFILPALSAALGVENWYNGIFWLCKSLLKLATMWGPQDISSFIRPSNYSYNYLIGVINQLSYLGGLTLYEHMLLVVSFGVPKSNDFPSSNWVSWSIHHFGDVKTNTACYSIPKMGQNAWMFIPQTYLMIIYDMIYSCIAWRQTCGNSQCPGGDSRDAIHSF